MPKPEQHSGQRDEDGARRFVEHMARTFADWGFPRMAARVLMALTSADEETLSAAELAERIGVSPAAISGAVRYLIQIGMVVREPVPSSRRDRYRLVDDSWFEVSVTKMTMFKSVADIAAEGATALGSATRGGARVAQLRDYFLFVQQELPSLLDKWQATKNPRPPS
jgi:DNA-binding transcriptional regulator GbsR (MarR family)